MMPRSDFNRRKAFYYLCGAGCLCYSLTESHAQANRSESGLVPSDFSLDNARPNREQPSMERYNRTGETIMRLIIMRHGVAHELGQDGSTTDADRTLTPKGIEEVQRVAESLKQIESDLQVVLTSPYQRARQTSSHVADLYGINVESEETLESGTKPKPLLRMLAGRRETCLMVCGHQPTLGQLISLACLGEKHTFYLKPAGMACVVFEDKIEPGSAYLEWLMQPKQLLHVSKLK